MSQPEYRSLRSKVGYLALSSFASGITGSAAAFSAVEGHYFFTGILGVLSLLNAASVYHHWETLKKYERQLKPDKS